MRNQYTKDAPLQGANIKKKKKKKLKILLSGKGLYNAISAVISSYGLKSDNNTILKIVSQHVNFKLRYYNLVRSQLLVFSLPPSYNLLSVW